MRLCREITVIKKIMTGIRIKNVFTIKSGCWGIYRYWSRHLKRPQLNVRWIGNQKNITTKNKLLRNLMSDR